MPHVLVDASLQETIPAASLFGELPRNAAAGDAVA